MVNTLLRNRGRQRTRRAAVARGSAGFTSSRAAGGRAPLSPPSLAPVAAVPPAPDEAMRSEAASAGFYTSPWGRHPRVQILTIEERLSGVQLDAPPPRQLDRTFRKPPRVAAAVPGTPRLDFEDLPAAAARSAPIAASSRSTTPRSSRTWSGPVFPAFTENTARALLKQVWVGLEPLGSAGTGRSMPRGWRGTAADSAAAAERPVPWLTAMYGRSCGPTGVSTRCARPALALRPWRVTRGAIPTHRSFRRLRGRTGFPPLESVNDS